MLNWNNPDLTYEQKWEIFIENQVVRFETEEHKEDPPGKMKEEPAIPDFVKCYTSYLAVPDIFGRARPINLDVKKGKVKAELSIGYSSIKIRVGQRMESEFQVLLTPDTIITETRDRMGFTISEAKPWDAITLRLPKIQDALPLISQLRDMVLRLTQSLFLRCEPEYLFLSAHAPPYQYLRFREGCKGDVGQFILGGYVLVANSAATLDQRYQLVWTELVGPDYGGMVRFLHFTNPNRQGVYFEPTQLFTGMEDYLDGNVLNVPRDKWDDGLLEARSREFYPLIFRCAEEARLWLDLGVAVRDGHRGRKNFQPMPNKAERVRAVNQILRQRFGRPDAPEVPLLETEDIVLDHNRRAPQDPEDEIKENYLKNEEELRRRCKEEMQKGANYAGIVVGRDGTTNYNDDSTTKYTMGGGDGDTMNTMNTMNTMRGPF